MDYAPNPTAIVLSAQIAYIALAAPMMVTWRRWQNGLVLAVMLGIIAAYAVGVLV